jgi:hypothetical protein
MPRILEASRNQGLTIVPIAVSPALVKSVPALASLQFANDPKTPLNKLSTPRREEVLVSISEQISAVLDVCSITNGLRAIDSAAYQATGLGGNAPTERRPDEFGAIASQGDTGLVMRQGSHTRTLITFQEVARLPEDVRLLIRAFDANISQHFRQYIGVFERRAATGPADQGRIDAEIASARKLLCGDLNGLVDLLERLNISLDDHYTAVRAICQGSA